jgi:RNA polymerase sigma-54 factor
LQGLKLEQRMRQEMTLQPQQILRSELIQLPLLELEMRVQAELEENPFLEEAEAGSDDDAPAPDPGDDSTPDTGADQNGDAAELIEHLHEEKREVDWDEILNDVGHWEYRAQSRFQPEDGSELPQPDITTLLDHLHDQLHLDNISPIEMGIGEEIIGNINRDGYLHGVTLEEIAQTARRPIELVQAVHRRIMLYDPVGIAARNLQECLLIQLETREPQVPIAERMIREFWEDFVNRRFEAISDKMGVTLDQVREAFQNVTRLNPKPGEGYFDEKQNYIIPDLIVTQVGAEFVTYLNDGDIPNFRINPAYRELYLRKDGADKKVREFLSRKLESARWFINAIHQRRTTMMRTMRAIVERQIEFYRKGPQYLKPMILADIADDISMDISTISRVTNGKYVQTDWGVFELKYFFSEAMETEDGEEVSNRVIKARLKDMIGEENKMDPLSDQELTDMLNKEGFQIRRRTVAKYREQLRIPIKRLRRQI